ncbi:MAG: nuclear transport factor 2 family protein [bacterium]|nr:nuclear transport factor 2 family protein [bacterium]
MSDAVAALVQRQMQAWINGDVETILADFAPDCVFITPKSRYQGHAQLRDLVQKSVSTTTNVHIDLTRMIVQGNQCALEWTWQETRLDSGKHARAEDAIIFELRDGQIIYWREYFNPAEMEN